MPHTTDYRMFKPEVAEVVPQLPEEALKVDEDAPSPLQEPASPAETVEEVKVEKKAKSPKAAS